VVPGGFTFNQYLVKDDEPLLFHTGFRRMFPLVREAIDKVLPAGRLRHAGFSHFEADESGALNDFLAIAPAAVPFASEIGTLISLNDIADRPPRGLAHGEEFCTGRHSFQWFYTPHVPHGWDCGILYDRSTGTLLCGDLFTQGGADHPPVTQSEVLSSSERFRKPLDYFAHSVSTSSILEQLAALRPELLACMHGSAYRGDGSALLRGLADILEHEAWMAATAP
jgi:flavorubredoxin